ncbi:MAG: patatin-like phospholipase family protein, partial [Candidatus Omnitrophota bacterium]
IPIDIIAGSSIGALIGSLYALGQTASEIERDVLRELSNAWKVCNLIDFNLFPVRGMLHGNQVVQLFKKYFKNKKFEDCQIPLKIVAADLSTWQAMTLDSGSVSDAVRASIAIPAIFKPVMHGSRVVVDGGIFSPLPIGSLRRSGAHKVIAVNVFPSALHAGEKYMMREAALADERTRCARRGPLRLGLWHLRRLLAKLFYPNVLDILMNTIQAMESEISDVEAQDADLLIRPVIPEANWVDFHKPRLFIQKGEEAAEALLPKIKELIRPRSA